MDRDADNRIEQQWVAQCARRLRQRWRTVNLASLEELATVLRRDERLSQLAPETAAVEWLSRGLPDA